MAWHATRRPSTLGSVVDVASGPGAITPDGCAVEVYSLLEPHEELDLVRTVVAAGSSILELGAGAGRVTRPLITAGYKVTAVDESQAMLDRFAGAGAEQILASIQTLDLGRRFQGVLLMSHLLNTHDDGLRREFLLCCQRHVARDGVVLVQRHPPAWFEWASDLDGADGEVVIRLRHVSRPTPDTVSATVHYENADRVWTQTFTAKCLSDEAVIDELASAGLAFGDWLDDERAWFTAGPIDSGGAG